MRPAKLIAIITATAILWGCSTQDGPDSKDIMLSDIVTMVSSTRADGTVFTFNRYDDQPLITLTAPTYSTDRIEAGQRVLLYYYPADSEAYTSGDIRVRSVQAINNGEVTIGPIADYSWDATPVWLNSVWRSGKYLNLRLRLSHSPSPRLFGIVADEATADDAMPHLYMMHDLDGEPESYLRDVIASIDISAIWDRPTCRGIVLHVNDSNLDTDTYTLAKTTDRQ